VDGGNQKSCVGKKLLLMVLALAEEGEEIQVQQ